MIQLQFKDFLFNRCLGGWVGKAVRILIQWWLLLRVQIPLEATFFFLLFKTFDVNFVQKCQICVENEKPEWKQRTIHNQFSISPYPEIFSIMNSRDKKFIRSLIYTNRFPKPEFPLEFFFVLNFIVLIFLADLSKVQNKNYRSDTTLFTKTISRHS